MLKIRFLRRGRKHQPFFYIVVCQKERSPKSGKYIEKLGFFDPKTKRRDLNKERIKYWMEKGAQVTPSVYNLLIEEKILKGKKIPVHKKPKKEKKEKAKEEETKEEETKEEMKEKEVKEEKIQEKTDQKQTKEEEESQS